MRRRMTTGLRASLAAALTLTKDDLEMRIRARLVLLSEAAEAIRPRPRGGFRVAVEWPSEDLADSLEIEPDPELRAQEAEHAN